MPELVGYRFVIQGNPAPWTVWVKKSEPPRGFLDMQVWQQQIMAELRHQWGNRPPIVGPVAVDTYFNLRWPETAPQLQARAIERWREQHIVMKPDLDNLRKAAVDAIAAILFETGDQQVVEGRMSKQFAGLHQEGYTGIVVRVLAADLAQVLEVENG